MDNAHPVVLTDALDSLSAATGHCWTRFDFFLLVLHCAVQLRAIVPADARTVLYPSGMFDGSPPQIAPMHRHLAIVYPFQVRELWTEGRTQTDQPWFQNASERGSEWFEEPVQVDFDNVRIPRSLLHYLVALWNAEKRSAAPLSNLPEWLWHATQKADAKTAPTRVKATPAAKRARETAKERPPRDDIDPARAYAGPVPSTAALQQRVLWLMNHFYATRASWVPQPPPVLRKIDIERQVFVRLAADGTLGTKRTRISQATIHKLTEAWCLPVASVPAVPRG